MSNFIWVRNPTIINGLATTYVSKRGSDTIGDGTAQNPYASIAKATSVAASGTNIMIDDGEWSESNSNNGRVFNFWGNSKTKLNGGNGVIFPLGQTVYSNYYNIVLYEIKSFGNNYNYKTNFYNCYCIKCNNPTYNGDINYYNCVIIELSEGVTSTDRINRIFDKCVIVNSTIHFIYATKGTISNCFLINCSFNYERTEFINCNFSNSIIPTTYYNIKNCINDATTGQTFADYFNYYDPNDWLKCDFTAKDGSKNIGAGEKGTTIGLNQGYTARADNSANDIFSAANGATVRNCAYSSSLNGYILEQVDRVCAGATSNTITFDADASSQSGYYIGLFVGITAGVGENQIRYITDYNGATKTATVSQAWDTIPDTESEYTISGKIDSAVKDFGKAIKVKRNFTFVDNMTALANGQWAEFLTAATAQNEMQPVSCFKWEYSVDGLTWRSGTELISATDGNNYVDNFTIGDASAQYNEAEAEFSVFRYVRFHIHIGFNIDNLAEA